MAGLRGGQVLLIGGGAIAAALLAYATLPQRRPAPVPATPGQQSGLIPRGYDASEGKYRLFDKQAPSSPVGNAAPTAALEFAPAVPDAPPVANAATIPDGSYDCRIWSGSSYVSLGTIRSVGDSLDTQLLAKVGATFTGAEATLEGITITYTTARGSRESMDCMRQ